MKKAFSPGKCPVWVLVGLPDVFFLQYMNVSTKGHKLIFPCIRKCSIQTDGVLSNTTCRTLTESQRWAFIPLHYI